MDHLVKQHEKREIERFQKIWGIQDFEEAKTKLTEIRTRLAEREPVLYGMPTFMEGTAIEESSMGLRFERPAWRKDPKMRLILARHSLL